MHTSHGIWQSGKSLGNYAHKCSIEWRQERSPLRHMPANRNCGFASLKFHFQRVVVDIGNKLLSTDINYNLLKGEISERCGSRAYGGVENVPDVIQ